MADNSFGLACDPFSIAPDPRFLYLAAPHREALASLRHGLQRGGGFILLTGEIGAGKTTVWRALLAELPPQTVVAYLANAKLSALALLRRLCAELQVDLPAEPGSEPPDLLDALHGHLLLAQAQGRETLIVIDEAQALSFDALEQLRLLTNLVTDERKLVQLLLIGQPELRAMLAMPEMASVSQRVVARYHLPTLSERDTVCYISYRLAVAGHSGEPLFTDAALQAIHRLCAGTPRRINVLCDQALLLAAQAGLPAADEAQVQQAALAAFGEPGQQALVPGPRAWFSVQALARGRGQQAWKAWLGPAALGLAMAGLAWWMQPIAQPPESRASEPGAAASLAASAPVSALPTPLTTQAATPISAPATASAAMPPTAQAAQMAPSAPAVPPPPSASAAPSTPTTPSAPPPSRTEPTAATATAASPSAAATAAALASPPSSAATPSSATAPASGNDSAR